MLTIPSSWDRRIAATVGLLLLLMLLAGGVWLVRAVGEAREAARQTACRGRLSYLAMALYNYHETYGSFPPAYVTNADGTPMHSWRVLLLPFLDQRDVYDAYDFAQPWDAPDNARLARRIDPDVFHCHSGPHVGLSPLTDYVVLVGAGTAFPGEGVTALADFRDGAENTILLAEIADSDIHWMEPRDLRIDEMSFVIDDPSRPSLSSPHPWGPGIVFADSIRAYRLSASLKPASLKALTTVAGGEAVSREHLLREDGRLGSELFQ